MFSLLSRHSSKQSRTTCFCFFTNCVFETLDTCLTRLRALFCTCGGFLYAGVTDWSTLLEKSMKQNGLEKNNENINFGNWSNLSERISSGSSTEEGTGVRRLHVSKPETVCDLSDHEYSTNGRPTNLSFFII